MAKTNRDYVCETMDDFKWAYINVMTMIDELPFNETVPFWEREVRNVVHQMMADFYILKDIEKYDRWYKMMSIDELVDNFLH